MVDPKDQFPVTLYINKQPRACFRSVKEAQGLMQLPSENFYMNQMELHDASTSKKWGFKGECWALIEGKK